MSLILYNDVMQLYVYCEKVQYMFLCEWMCKYIIYFYIVVFAYIMIHTHVHIHTHIY